ncbi:MAG TPA: hypothetical protein VFU31_21180 [Candidatus Binatia bacterium]|nr:hypothetical protein [Candidatus Binatia bacterium]
MDEQQLIDQTTEALDLWAMVEIFGHTKVAGRLTERKIGVNVMLQVDVPKGDKEFSHSRLFGPAAIFSINPTTEAWCRKWTASQAQYERSPLPYVPEAPKQLNEVQGPDDDVTLFDN